MLSATSITAYRKDHPRLTNHFGLAFFSLLGCIVAGVIGGPGQSFLETVALGSGYVALLLVLLTLAIGPINMLKKRKNPVNMMFRRDAGIWAGITAILHIIASLTLYFGGNLLLYFFSQDSAGGLTFSFDLFYLSNYVGVIAGLVILFLLVLSNNYFLKKFKGPKWKQFQRFNYLLFVVALLHTFGQEITNNRNSVLIFGVIALSAFVVVAQSTGFVVYRRRDRERKAASTKPATANANAARPKPGLVSGPAPVLAPAMSGFMTAQPAYATAQLDKGLGRRRFLLMTGTVILSGAVGGLAAKVVAKTGETSLTTASNPTGAVSATTASTGTTQAAATSDQTATSAAIATTSGTTASTATTGAASTTAATSAATTAAASSTASTTAAASTAAATTAAATKTATTSGTVLATIASLAAGKAIAVTTPDTKKAAFVIHRQDGSVACFSGICTHEPVNLTFDASQQTLYCPKHGVPFNTQTGAPERGPARTALAQYKVTVDSQGQIIYG